MSEYYTQAPQPNPEYIQMSRHDTVMIDPMQSIYDATEVGLPNETDYYKFGIVAEVAIHGVRDEGKSFIVIRSDNKFNGMSDVYLAGISKDEAGKRTLSAGKKGWVHVEPGKALTIGRLGADVDGEQLVGSTFGPSISRKHLAVELKKDGVVIGDSSSNGISVLGYRTSEGRQATQAVKHGLIDGIPKTTAEAEAARVAEHNQNIDEEIGKVLDQLKALKDGLSDKDDLALWKYSSGLLNKKEAQERGDGQESYNQEAVAGEGYREMSDKARERMHDYHSLMIRNNYLRALRK